MIWDTVLFSGEGTEPDMLECRLYELEEHDDLHHVVVEARYDHQGHPKPLYFQEYAARWAPWRPRITYVVADIPGGDVDVSPWVRENHQREQIRLGLGDAVPADVLLLCDVDEIPSASALARMRVTALPSVVTLVMRMGMFAVDWVLPAPQEIAVAGYVGDVWNFPFALLRNNAHRKANPQLPDAGWHFSWLGGPEEIKRKADRFCHLELRDLILLGNDTELWYQQGHTFYDQDWTHKGVPAEANIKPMKAATVDDSWPRYIWEGRCPRSWFRPGSPVLRVLDS